MRAADEATDGMRRAFGHDHDAEPGRRADEASLVDVERTRAVGLREQGRLSLGSCHGKSFALAARTLRAVNYFRRSCCLTHGSYPASSCECYRAVGPTR